MVDTQSNVMNLGLGVVSSCSRTNKDLSGVEILGIFICP